MSKRRPKFYSYGYGYPDSGHLYSEGYGHLESSEQPRPTDLGIVANWYRKDLYGDMALKKEARDA